jgi:hypothetical protein
MKTLKNHVDGEKKRFSGANNYDRVPKFVEFLIELFGVRFLRENGLPASPSSLLLMLFLFF